MAIEWPDNEEPGHRPTEIRKGLVFIRIPNRWLEWIWEKVKLVFTHGDQDGE